ncbi:hypothetical protein [Novosphingobium sp.]|uniref:hypothetical protein n=1 Tax=Novosphingobium sp. TaxID=1874826 RepID=UPI002611AFDA|nr:hypothetical protein [Novosphingobium sp.]
MTDSETPKSEAETEADAGGAKPTDPLGKVKGFVEEHPVAMVAGGIVLGALVAGALSRAGSGVTGDKATRKGSLSRMSLPRRAADLAAAGLELAAAYVAGAVGEKAAAAGSETEAATPAKPDKPRLPDLAGKALRTLAPVIARRLPGKKAD